MEKTAEIINIDEQTIGPTLREVADKFDKAGGEVVLDFSSIRRVDSSAVRALERVAGIADEKAVRVVLHGVNIDVYKTLKLVKLAQRFSFAS